MQELPPKIPSELGACDAAVGFVARFVDLTPIASFNNLCIDYQCIGELMRKRGTKRELMPGTLEMLILKILTRQSLHGYGIAQRIRQTSDEVLNVDEGSLYPALQRLELEGWVTSEWRMTDLNRRARFYELTVAGREQLAVEVDQFDRLFSAIARVLQTD